MPSTRPRPGRPHHHRQLVDLEGLLRPGNIDVDHGPEIGIGARIVHEGVQTAEALDGLGQAGLGLRGFADVGGLPRHLGRIGATGYQTGCGFGQVIRLAGAEHDVGPGPEKAPGHGQADAPTGSGDDRRLALERR